MTIDVETCSIYWCAFSRSKPKLFWKYKQNEVRLNVSTPQGQPILLVQITRVFSFILQIRVITSFFQVFCYLFFKGTHLGICRNGILYMWARLFMFLANYLRTVSLLIYSRSYQMLDPL